MTDLKPEDLERVERLLARAIVAANSSAPVETHLGLACEFIGAREDFLSLLADRARMEKALAVGRTLADAVRLHGYPVSDEHWRKSSGSMSHQARALHLAATAFRQALDGASQ